MTQVALSPQDHLAAARMYLGKEDWAGAEPHLRTLFEIVPNNADVLALLTCVYSNLQRFAEGAEIYRRAKPLITPDHIFYTNFITFLLKCNAFEEVAGICTEAEKAGFTDANILFNHATALDYMGESRSALPLFERAYAMQPDNLEFRRVLGALKMKLFNPAIAAREYGLDLIFARAHDFPFPRWQGEPLKDKSLFIWKEQGIGDVMMFAGFLPYVLKQDGNITVAMTVDMMSIYKRSFPAATIIPFTQEEKNRICAEDKFDYHCPLGDLMVYCFDNYKPREIKGYLKADPELTKKARTKYEALGPGPYIGMSWTTLNPTTNVIRNIPLSEWTPLFQLKGFRFISLQYGYLDEELNAYMKKTGVHVDTIMDVDPMKDREEFFGHIAALDAVVSVQNSNIHIAGSLGIDAMIMLSKSGEFRWRTEGTDCWWYPTVTINRQEEFRNWKPVIHRACDWLKNKFPNP